MYDVELRPRAEKDIAALPPSVARRILDRIASLAENPRQLGVQKLQAEGGFRLRLGDYRIVVDLDDDARRVTIVRVRHRRDVYRNP